MGKQMFFGHLHVGRKIPNYPQHPHGGILPNLDFPTQCRLPNFCFPMMCVSNKLVFFETFSQFFVGYLWRLKVLKTSVRGQPNNPLTISFQDSFSTTLPSVRRPCRPLPVKGCQASQWNNTNRQHLFSVDAVLLLCCGCLILRFPMLSIPLAARACCWSSIRALLVRFSV